MPITHEVRYFTRKTPADARARCSCGWFTFGTLDECVDAAKVHNDWEEVTIGSAGDAESGSGGDAGGSAEPVCFEPSVTLVPGQGGAGKPGAPEDFQ